MGVVPQLDIKMTNEITNDLVAWAAKQVDRIDPEIGNTSKNYNGDAYVTLCCGGVKPEGEKFPVLVNEAESAIDFWKHSFTEYASKLGIDGPKKLWWRQHPSLIECTADGDTYLTIRARLVVTNA